MLTRPNHTVQQLPSTKVSTSGRERILKPLRYRGLVAVIDAKIGLAIISAVLVFLWLGWRDYNARQRLETLSRIVSETGHVLAGWAAGHPFAQYRQAFERITEEKTKTPVYGRRLKAWSWLKSDKRYVMVALVGDGTDPLPPIDDIILHSPILDRASLAQISQDGRSLKGLHWSLNDWRALTGCGGDCPKPSDIAWLAVIPGMTYRQPESSRPSRALDMGGHSIHNIDALNVTGNLDVGGNLSVVGEPWLPDRKEGSR